MKTVDKSKIQSLQTLSITCLMKMTKKRKEAIIQEMQQFKEKKKYLSRESSILRKGKNGDKMLELWGAVHEHYTQTSGKNLAKKT